jgi:DNA-3-methyladenine glycosylase
MQRTHPKLKYKPLPRTFFQRDTFKLVPEVLGKILVRKIGKTVIAGRIVEVEAYVGSDPASHAANGMTARNRPMFEDGGISYVYFTYGMHFCFNIVTEQSGFPAALLVRALEPLEGIDAMKKHRKTNDERNLTNGPAKLCQALAIDRELNGIALDGKVLYIANDGYRIRPGEIATSPRIGIRVGTGSLWRFYLGGNDFVSKP